jgi:hypothetical protein
MPGLSSGGAGIIAPIVRRRGSSGGPAWAARSSTATWPSGDPGLRVLFTSGYPQRELTPSATLDRDNFLPKPYTPAELARRVRAVLDDAAVS